MTGTISSVLLLMTLYRTLAGFLGFLRDSGPLSTLVAAVTTLIGPHPHPHPHAHAHAHPHPHPHPNQVRQQLRRGELEESGTRVPHHPVPVREQWRPQEEVGDQGAGEVGPELHPGAVRPSGLR